MYKIVASLLIMIGTSGLGYSIYTQKKRRLGTLKEMLSCMEMMKNEISYKKAGFPEICKCIASRCNEPFSTFFDEVVRRIIENNGNRFIDCWREARIKLESGCLSNEDIVFFLDFLPEAGFDNIEMQVIQLDMAMEEHRTNLSELSKALTKDRKLYLSMGIMAGLFGCILLW